MRQVWWAFLLLTLLAGACASPAPLKGTDLGEVPAPEFRLADPSGRAVSLAGLRGRVVVLTFLYTHCPDECPLIAEKLHATAGQMGDAMSKVSFVAISVDPDNDTPAAIQAFLRQHQIEGQLTFLTGSNDQLASVWAAYYIAARANADAASSASVLHSTRVLVIDQAGNERVNFDSDFSPADLTFDLQALLAGR
jgi:protein SCO1/2